MSIEKYSEAHYQAAFEHIDLFRMAYREHSKSVVARKLNNNRAAWLADRLDIWFSDKKELQDAIRPFYEVLRIRIDALVKLERKTGIEAVRTDTAFWEIFFDSLMTEMKQDNAVLNLQNDSAVMAKTILSEPRPYTLMKLFPEIPTSFMKHFYKTNSNNPTQAILKFKRDVLRLKQIFPEALPSVIDYFCLHNPKNPEEALRQYLAGELKKSGKMKQ